MKSYLLDTSTIINYLRGVDLTVEMINNIEGEMCSSYICLSELYEGVYRVKEQEKAEKVVKDFFQSLSEVYTVDEKIAKQFGEIRAHLKKTGKVLEDIDIFIAATCVVYGLTLITENKKHFFRIKNLEILS